jgi:hypothetical protein
MHPFFLVHRTLPGYTPLVLGPVIRLFPDLVRTIGPGREKVFQSLHEIRLVKNLLPPGPSTCDLPDPSRKYAKNLFLTPLICYAGDRVVKVPE